MDRSYWFKQLTDKPLFPDLIWSRPENKMYAGKLLIIGGNLYGFAGAAEAYSESLKSGIGASRVLLPDSLKKTVGRILEDGAFSPSTPSGSFSQKSLDEFLSQSSWSDGVLLAGDFGRNSETAVVIEKFLKSYSGQVTITKDTIEYITSNPEQVINRGNTTLVLSLSQLQRLVSALKYSQPVTFNMDLLRLIDLLHDFSQSFKINILTKHQDNILAAVNGDISSTIHNEDIWCVQSAARSAVWWLQNPNKTFESITTAVIKQS